MVVGSLDLKHHIAGGNVNVEMCIKQGKKVRDLFINMVYNAKLKKLNKAVAQREYEEAMCNIQDVSDSDDEFETQHQGYDLDDLEQARRESLASHHNEKQLHRGGSLRMEEWLNPLTGDIEMAVASISSPITEKLGYPIIGFLVTGCPNQVTYDRSCTVVKTLKLAIAHSGVNLLFANCTISYASWWDINWICSCLGGSSDGEIRAWSTI
ncbi:hypothetical protein IFM89_016152, partial [Coptis chinensis]